MLCCACYAVQITMAYHAGLTHRPDMSFAVYGFVQARPTSCAGSCMAGSCSCCGDALRWIAWESRLAIELGWLSDVSA